MNVNFQGGDQYDHSIALQPSMFYYAAAAASAGPSLISQQEAIQTSMENKTTVDTLCVSTRFIQCETVVGSCCRSNCL